MNPLKITYWITTALVALMMLFSAYAYFTSPDVKVGFVHLGFPDYFRIELAVAKFLGAIALLIPVVTRFKEWVYAGFTINFISAFIAHMALGDPINNKVMPLILLAVLFTSYYCYVRLNPAPQKAL